MLLNSLHRVHRHQQYFIEFIEFIDATQFTSSSSSSSSTPPDSLIRVHRVHRLHRHHPNWLHRRPIFNFYGLSMDPCSKIQLLRLKIQLLRLQMTTLAVEVEYSTSTTTRIVIPNPDLLFGLIFSFFFVDPNGDFWWFSRRNCIRKRSRGARKVRVFNAQHILPVLEL